MRPCPFRLWEGGKHPVGIGRGKYVQYIRGKGSSTYKSTPTYPTRRQTVGRLMRATCTILICLRATVLKHNAPWVLRIRVSVGRKDNAQCALHFRLRIVSRVRESNDIAIVLSSASARLQSILVSGNNLLNDPTHEWTIINFCFNHRYITNLHQLPKKFLLLGNIIKYIKRSVNYRMCFYLSKILLEY